MKRPEIAVRMMPPTRDARASLVGLAFLASLGLGERDVVTSSSMHPSTRTARAPWSGTHCAWAWCLPSLPVASRPLAMRPGKDPPSEASMGWSGLLTAILTTRNATDARAAGAIPFEPEIE